MNIYSKLAAVAALSVGVLAAGAASARIVCNEDGDCWHSRETFEIVPGLGLSIRPDDWKFKEAENYRWREHEGRGYWRKGEWRNVE